MSGGTSGSSRKSLECSDGGEYFFESAASIGTRENAYPPVGNARALLRPLSWQDSQLNDDWISQRRFSEFQRPPHDYILYIHTEFRENPSREESRKRSDGGNR